jgi:hypothetical protein
MKFAQELEESAVPEWRNMYMDYKGGKKKWKALSRVVKDIGSATTPDQAVESPFVCLRHAPVRSLLARRRRHARGQLAEEPATSSHEYQDQVPPLHEDPTPQADVAPINERSPLKQEACRPRIGRYGSIQGSQSGDEDDAVLSRAPSAPSLQLPRPAIDAPTYDDHEHGRPLGSESTTITSGDAVNSRFGLPTSFNFWTQSSTRSIHPTANKKMRRKSASTSYGTNCTLRASIGWRKFMLQTLPDDLPLVVRVEPMVREQHTSDYPIH